MGDRMRKALALTMALLMLVSTACGKDSGKDNQGGNKVGENGYPEYLNLDSAYPIIKDEYAGTVKLKVALVQTAEGGEWEDLWLSKYLKEKYNIELDVEVILDAAAGERKNLMFATGDLPDIIINMNLSSNELYKYGQEEGMLLKMDEYMNDTLTPNLLNYFESNAEVKSVCTLPDGHVYSAPWIFSESDEGRFTRIFLNKAWLDGLGIEMPKTLDDFTNAMYAVKKADPSGVGSENLYPLSGGMGYNTTYYILNAFGYVTSDGIGTAPAIRDGKVVIPAYDTAVYKEYLTLLNQYYKDGIIDPKFFVITDQQIVNRVNNGQAAVFREPVYLLGITSFDEWEACYPLTSKWQEEPEWVRPEFVAKGGFVVSAETKYPELCMRIADMYYNSTTDDCRALWIGTNDPKYDFGYVCPEINEDGIIAWNESAIPNKMSSWSYLMRELVGTMPNFGACETAEANEAHYRAYGVEMPDSVKNKEFDLTSGDGNYRASVAKNLVPYSTYGFPYTYYVDEETQTRISDLTTVIEPYISQQFAMFVTGQRPLSQVEDFAKELKSMGVEELLEIYREIYADSNYKEAR